MNPTCRRATRLRPARQHPPRLPGPTRIRRLTNPRAQRPARRRTCRPKPAGHRRPPSQRQATTGQSRSSHRRRWGPKSRAAAPSMLRHRPPPIFASRTSCFGWQRVSARVHLETLAGRRQLDLRGLLDLAESRWRTADLAGAGETMTAYLEAGGEAPSGFLSSRGDGRAGTARRGPQARPSSDGRSRAAARRGIRGPAAVGPLAARPGRARAAGRDAVPGGAHRRRARRPHRAHHRPATCERRWRRASSSVAAVAASGSSSDADPAASMPIVSGGVEPDRSIWDAGPPVAPNAQVELDAARAALEAGDRAPRPSGSGSCCA